MLEHLRMGSTRLLDRALVVPPGMITAAFKAGVVWWFFTDIARPWVPIHSPLCIPILPSAWRIGSQGEGNVRCWRKLL